MATTRVINSFDQIVSGEFKRTATDFHNRINTTGVYRPDAGRYVHLSLMYLASTRCDRQHRT